MNHSINHSFQDKVVIVTGAGTGIGEAAARDFVELGAKVAFVGRRLAMLEAASEGLPAEQVLCCSCDVADRAAVNQTAKTIIERFGPVDILVNNAGTNSNPRTVGDIEPDAWDTVIAVNLTGAFNFVQAVLPGMREKKDGLIINVSSIAGLRASELAGSAYSASKHGMVSLNHSINQEEVDSGIRACVICPGEVETPILDRRPNPPSAEHRAQILQAADVSAAILFVAGLPPRACVPEIIIKPTIQPYK